MDTKKQKSNNKFAIKFIIFTIFMAIVTVIAIYFTIQYFDKNIEKETSQTNNNVEENKKIEDEQEIIVEKSKAKDSKYGIKTYTETYNSNSLEYTFYADINGELRELENESEFYKEEFFHISGNKTQYLQIKGLKNKTIESSINDRLKQVAYELKSKDKNSRVTTHINADFSNILSITISSENAKVPAKYLNINLTNGEDIPFEEIFVSSAPINSLLSQGLYESLAWNVELEGVLGEEQYQINSNMDKRDTSEYEDKFLLLANRYNTMKNQLEYSISNNCVQIFNLVDKTIEKPIYDLEYLTIDIDFVENKEEIAIYKRYLTEQSIFENDELGEKNIVIFTDKPANVNYKEELEYGKIADNMFVEKCLFIQTDKKSESAYNKIIQYIQKESKKGNEETKSQLTDDKGMFFQVEYTIQDNSEEEGYTVIADISKAICDREYFDENGFKDFINLKSKPTALAELLKFNYYEEEFKNFDKIGEKILYEFDGNGTFIKSENW